MNFESPLALAYRTPLEDSFVGISAALSTELSVEALLDQFLDQLGAGSPLPDRHEAGVGPLPPVRLTYYHPSGMS